MAFCLAQTFQLGFSFTKHDWLDDTFLIAMLNDAYDQYLHNLH